MTKPIEIKTLDDILADMGKSAPSTQHTLKKDHQNHQNNAATDKPATPPKNKQNKTTPQHDQPKPTKTANKHSTITPLFGDKHQQILDDKTLQLLSEVEIQKLELPDKATSYMRWLAFYYLSRRELSTWQLKSKLLAKECNPVAVDELLDEFAKKGYQSDERCASMLVRETIRKGRGVRYLSEQLKKAKLDARDFGGVDVLIQRADVQSMTDGTILETDGDDEINWLKLAVEARCKKYGDDIPKTPKEKARQLRFLQYRGFCMDVCFDALKMNLGDFDE